MTPLVADASVVVKCLIPESGSGEAVRLVSIAHPLLAPDIVHAESANAIWRAVRRRRILPEDAEWAMSLLLRMSITTLRLAPLTPAALTIALEYDHPVYDCYYVAAAIQNDAALATADERLYDLALRVGLGERAILLR